MRSARRRRCSVAQRPNQLCSNMFVACSFLFETRTSRCFFSCLSRCEILVFGSSEVTFSPVRIGSSLQALVFLFSNLTSFSACSHELSTVHQNFANLLAAFTSKQAVGVRSSLPDFPLKTIVNLIYWSWLSPLGVMLSKGQGEIILHLTLIFYLIQFLPSN